MPLIRPRVGPQSATSFAPSFFEQYGQMSSQQSSLQMQLTPTDASPFSAASSTVPPAAASQRGRSLWTTGQTDVLVNSWRDAFVELESNKNSRAWKRILEKVNKAGGKRTLEQIKKRLSYLKDRHKEAKAKEVARQEIPHHIMIYLMRLLGQGVWFNWGRFERRVSQVRLTLK